MSSPLLPEMEEEGLELPEELGLQAFTHADLEGEAAKQAERAMLEREVDIANTRKQKENDKIRKLQSDLTKVDKLVNSSFGLTKKKYQAKHEEIVAKINEHHANISDIDNRILQRAAKVQSAAQQSSGQRAGESRREFLIRKGVINPFSKDETLEEGEVVEEEGQSQFDFQNLRAPGFEPSGGGAKSLGTTTKRAKVSVTRSVSTSSEGSPEPTRKVPPPSLDKPTRDADDAFKDAKPLKRRKVREGKDVITLTDDDSKPPSRKSTPTVDQRVAGFEDDYEPASRAMRTRRSKVPTLAEQESDGLGDETSDEYKEDGEVASQDDEEKEEEGVAARKIKKGKKPRGRGFEGSEDEVDLTEFDDGYEEVYQTRISSWSAQRSAARHRLEGAVTHDDTPEWFRPSPSAPDYSVDKDFKIPGDIAQSLFDYQKTAVGWFWELHARQHTGGILGDEMGLGKTIQTIAFIAGLHYSRRLTKPVLIVAPATVLRQWSNEFHKWWPPLRVSILHSSGSGMMSIAAAKKAERSLDDDEGDVLEILEKSAPTRADKAARKIVDKVKSNGHVLIATYSGLETYQKLLLSTDWECVVLDEGHKIRNPDAKISLAAKRLRSSTRLILSGTPIQNDLRELWSLFDFVYPGKLGIYPVFNEHIQTPIRLGAYANASNVEVHAAIKCATVLRELIEPYILRRLKADVAVLPPKQDQVLFCNLVKQQKEAYEKYIKSPEVAAIISGKRDILSGIDVLRKICNHPDLCNRDKLLADPKYIYGSALKSGKLQIVKGLLKSWETDRQKCLVFSQGVQMLDILEKFVKNLGYKYLRMDGSTDVKSRQGLVERFNRDPSVQVFVMTTRVGGYGVNLTGATRIIIFDPDWNPSNDQQARERAWRLGQKHEVRIYRLLSRGTIEEKIYQRQLYKQFLQKQILEDPDQHRVFKMDDVTDLFSFGSVEKGTETGSLFEGVERTLAEAKKVDDDEQSKNIEAMAGVEKLENFLGGPADLLGGSMDANTKASSAGAEGDKPEAEKTKAMTKTTKKGNLAPSNGDPLLDSILQKAGVHSIVEHDKIMSSSKSMSKIIEDAATNVATKARHALKQSFEFVQQHAQPADITWTGKQARAMKEGADKKKKGEDMTKLRRDEIEPAFRRWMAEKKQKKVKVTGVMVMDYFNPRLNPSLASRFKIIFRENTVKVGDYWELRSDSS